MTFAVLFNRGQAIVLAALMLAATAALPDSASAHAISLNFRWAFTDGSQQALHLYYERDCLADYVNADAVATAWTQTETPLYYHYISGCNGSIGRNRIWLLNGYDADGGLGWTETYHYQCALGFNCYWDFNWGVSSQIDAVRIYVNHQNRAYDLLTWDERRDVLMHELGHGMGLRHAGYYLGEYPDSRGWPYGVYSIMDYCCPSDYTGSPWWVPRMPSAHDADNGWVFTSGRWTHVTAHDINQLYPSWYW